MCTRLSIYFDRKREVRVRVLFDNNYIMSTFIYGSDDMRGFRKFSQRGSNLDNVFFLFLFLLDEGRRKDPNTTTISGPFSATSETPGVSLACR